jgi:hypothetical protein
MRCAECVNDVLVSKAAPGSSYKLVVMAHGVLMSTVLLIPPTRKRLLLKLVLPCIQRATLIPCHPVGKIASQAGADEIKPTTVSIGSIQLCATVPQISNSNSNISLIGHKSKSPRDSDSTFS